MLHVWVFNRKRVLFNREGVDVARMSFQLQTCQAFFSRTKIF